MKTKTNVKSGGFATNHNAGMKTRTSVKAGCRGKCGNHNASLKTSR